MRVRLNGSAMDDRKVLQFRTAMLGFKMRTDIPAGGWLRSPRRWEVFPVTDNHRQEESTP